MRIPSPDGLLIDLFDRAGAALQRRGLLLPTVRTPLPFLEVGALGLLGIVLGEGIAGPYGLLIVFMAVMQTRTGLKSARERRAEALAWSAAARERYLEEALWIRENAVLRRGIGLVQTFVFATLAAVALAKVGLGTPTAGLFCLLLWSLGRLSEAYAETALPRL